MLPGLQLMDIERIGCRMNEILLKYGEQVEYQLIDQCRKGMYPMMYWHSKKAIRVKYLNLRKFFQEKKKVKPYENVQCF